MFIILLFYIRSASAFGCRCNIVSSSFVIINLQVNRLPVSTTTYPDFVQASHRATMQKLDGL